LAIRSVYKRRKEGFLGLSGFLFWSLFWIFVAVVVAVPESANSAARLFGIGRGADFAIYSSIGLIFFILFRLHIKIESIGRDITKLTRHQALEEKNE